MSVFIENLQFLGRIFFTKRKSADINLFKFGEFLEIHHTTLRAWFSGESKPTSKTLETITPQINDLLGIVSDGQVVIQSLELTSDNIKQKYFKNRFPSIQLSLINDLDLIKQARKNKVRSVPVWKSLNDETKIGLLPVFGIPPKDAFAIRVSNNIYSSLFKPGDYAILTKEHTKRPVIAFIQDKKLIIQKTISENKVLLDEHLIDVTGNSFNVWRAILNF